MTELTHPNESHPRDGRFSPTSLEDACPRKYWLGKVLGIQPLGTKDYLNMGTAVHSFIEEWQILRKSGVQEEELLARAIENSLPTALASLPSWPGDKYSLENWLFTMEGYHYRWKDTVEDVFATESINWIPMGNGTMLGGVIDQLIRTPSGGIIIRDTKTTGGGMTDWFWKGMENKFQLSIYFHMVEQLLPNEDVIGVEIDAVQIQKKREKVENNYHRRLFERTDLQISDAIRTYIKKTNFYKEGLALPQEEQAEHFYCEQSQCSNYGGCPFMPICKNGINSPCVHTDFTINA